MPSASDAPVASAELEALVQRVLDDAADEDEGRHRVSLLVSAAQAVTRDLDLTTALQRIVEVARELVRARYGALGVIAPDGGLERFLHAGFTDEQIRKLGAPPSGRGILGAVITDDATIRLQKLSDDPRSVGFPAHHPPMDSFLGVPIHVDGLAFGNLYLTEREHGPFDDLDESVIATLAAMAGSAIANSRLYHQSELSRRWLEASEEINRRLLSGEISPDEIDEVAETAHRLGEARAVIVLARSADGWLRVEHGDGDSVDLDAARRALQDALDSGDQKTLAAVRLDVAGPVAIAPLLGSLDRPSGALAILRGPGGHPFTEAEEETVARFTRSVAIARELARTRIDEQRVALADERDRIARDLHDHVIQSLFAVGLSLQSVVGDPTSPTGARIATQVDAIDATIRQIRQAIYHMSAPVSAHDYSLRARINTLVRETLEGEDLDSRLDFSGPVDTLVDTSLGDEVAAVVRESLSNAVRHAHASRVTISVAVRGAEVTIEVVDDGRGLGETSRRSGLENLRARAVERGGEFSVTDSAPHGTAVRWSVPWGAS